MALSYNQPRFAQNLLAKFKKCPPSFTISLYDDHWTLNKGPSKFLYTQPVSSLLEDVRALRIPVDFIEIFDMAHVPYYDGCMVVESIDYRKPHAHHQQSQTKEPESVRVVLQPTPESFYADICLLNAKNGNKWSDQDALDIESKILNATSPPLCLEPDVNLTRIVNSVSRATTSSDTVPSKRKHAHKPEEDENDKAKRAKLWSQYMHPHNGKPSSLTQNKRSIFDILQEVAQKDEKGIYVTKWKQSKPDATPSLPQSQPHANNSFTPPAAVVTAGGLASTPAAPSAQEDQKTKAKLKGVKRPEAQETQLPLTKGKNKPGPSVPAPGASLAPDQRKAGHAIPGVARTPVDPNSAIVSTASASPQYQQPPQPPKGVLKKPDEPVAQPQPHPSQPHPGNSTEQQHHPAAWQAPIPGNQFPPQPSQGKQKPAHPQASPFHSHTPVPGFAGNVYPQNAAYKTAANVQQNPNVNPNRSSPMVHNQPLLSRSPLPPHTQSPHPQVQQPSQAPQTAPHHQLAQHPAQHSPHQFNIHMQQQQARFNPAAMQGQMGHHPHQIPQQHHVQHPNAPRAGQLTQHDQSQAMLQHMQHFNAIQQQFPYSQMHVQGMMNGIRIPGAQGAGGQFMPAPAWRVPAGRGGGPMAPIPMGVPHGQAFQHPQMIAALGRGQPQQQQPPGQGR